MLLQHHYQRCSKRLSYLLRHSHDYISLDGGWAPVEHILTALRKTYPQLERADLEAIVAQDQKGRYSFDSSGSRIRANQGHSVPGVVIEMERPEPPELLYHGTASRFLDSIFQEGLRPMSRQYVHISSDPATARIVGARHGTPVVLLFRAGDFVRAGHPLMRSANGVWQAEAVPPEYLSVMEREGSHEALD
ncbi:MAG: RNA 2'-phosphotransferase [Oscillospiraceae bacterium]|nr:RNA 2'-phosphotransferase [Oscillospiraceae bacterium]